MFEKLVLFNRTAHKKTPRGCPRGLMVKNDRLRNRSTRVRTPVTLLHSLSGKIPLGKGMNHPYPPQLWVK